MIHRQTFLAFATVFLILTNVSAQTLLDVSGGSSNSDYVFTNLAFRKQINDRFRIGVEAQAGSVRYRFIEAKPIREGYSTMLSVPLLYRLYQTEHIRLDLYTRIGIRFQGVIDPDDNDERDQTLTSTALNVEPGLMVSVPISEKLQLHGGLTLPNIFELSPEFIYENNISAITGGASYRINDQKIFFIKALTGGAAGADGDSQKYSWSAQAGVRILLGKKPKGNPLVLESSY